ncbi:MAG: hypothetical protein HY040_11380 [Planctomycetes bacterium]|nr:hypothetical protein [Planctomycetota bacterium]
MKGILADVNIEGYVDQLVTVMQADPWRLFWDYFQLRYVRFHDVGLSPQAPDSIVWHTCQRQSLFLITDNRNKDAPDSLEATIRMHTTSTSLPVFTVGDIPRLRRDLSYAQKVIENLFIYLLQEDSRNRSAIPSLMR